MPGVRLSDEDRKRFDCPEVMPIDLQAVTNREAIELAKLGYATPRLWQRALEVTPIIDDDGNRVPGGYRMDYLAWTGVVWVALRRSGVNVPLGELEFDINGLEYVPDPELDETPKDESPPGEAEPT